MAPSILWFRRDLRLADHPALRAAVEEGGADGVVGCFVVDRALCGPSGPARARFLADSLRALDADMGGRLVVRAGVPARVLPALAGETGARSVFVTADCAPYGRRRDTEVAGALEADGRRLVAVGTPYAVAPGVVRTGGGGPYRVFTPFRRAWAEEGWDPPSAAPRRVAWRRAEADAALEDIVAGSGAQRPDWWADLPAGPPPVLPEAGEEAAHRVLGAFVRRALTGYADGRNQTGTAGTSRLSPYLRFGSIHPRQVLGRLERAGPQVAGRGPEVFRSEIAWREFYADVLFHQPRSAAESLQPAMAGLVWDTGPEAEARFRQWALGRTGYPMVDAAMRQLLAEGWVHNRARMVAASFLVKDLHLHWRWGARWFMYRLVDGDLASNQHGWQWTAGTGTDAAPFPRVFNPMTQGERFDPDGAYVRRYVPELAGAPAAGLHDPRPAADGVLPLGGDGGDPPGGGAYPPPMVDHATERRDALERFEAVRAPGRRDAR